MRARYWLAWVSVVCAPQVQAQQSTVTNPPGQPNRAIATTVNLDFRINMDKFIFFRVGSGAFPNTSSVVDRVSFQLQPSIPPGALVPANGNNQGLAWNGVEPSFIALSSNNVVPIDVRSNAGQVSIRATVDTPLSNGSEVIPMSQLSVTSSNADLPAPPIPNSGTGAAVNVAGTSFSGLVTSRQANWTFGFTNSTPVSAGTYSGRLRFTASTP